MGRKIQKLTEEEWSELNNGSKGNTTSQTSIEWLYAELAKNNNSNDSIKERIYKQSQIWKDAKEMHYKELMDSMQRGMELQEKESNRIGFRERNGLLPQQEKSLSEKWKEYQNWLNEPPEISDEEIEKFADEELGTIRTDFDFGVIQGMKWYREQLKQR